MGESLEDLGPVLPGGSHLYRQKSPGGGWTYMSDEVGGGVVVWDTSLVSDATLMACLLEEQKRRYTLKKPDND